MLATEPSLTPEVNDVHEFKLSAYIFEMCRDILKDGHKTFHSEAYAALAEIAEEKLLEAWGDFYDLS